MSDAPAYPLLMEPAFQARPWGGNRMRDVLGKRIPAGLAGSLIGESWEISAHANGLSRVARGPAAGMTIPELLEAWGERLVGARFVERYGTSFPLLVKILEVNSLASVQVHPNDEQAARLEGYPSGKTEAWYIIDAGPEAEVYIGFRPGTSRESFLRALERGGVRETLARVPLWSGDCALLEPGTVHACGNGILLLEIQQSSDITYRVYDWDRVDREGKRRELHVDKALEVIDFAAVPRVERAELVADQVVDILSSPQFRVFQVSLRSNASVPAGGTFRSLTVVRGSGELSSHSTRLELRTGDSVLIPAGLDCALQGEALLVGADPVL